MIPSYDIPSEFIDENALMTAKIATNTLATPPITANPVEST